MKIKFLNRFIPIALLLMIVGCQQTHHQEYPLKVISYNVYVGMSQDTTTHKDEFVNWIKTQDPDVMAFQEMNNFTQSKLEKMAKRYGHPYAILLKDKGYPVALTSKYPITHVDKVVDNMHHGFIYAKIKDIQVIVTHLSPHQYKKRQEEIALLLDYIKNVHGTSDKWLLMGDFNTYSPLDSFTYQDGRLLDRIKQLSEKYPTRKNLVDGKIDYSVIQSILDDGFKDALKCSHQQFVSTAPTHTIEHKFLSEQPEFRIDYIFTKGFKENYIESEVIRDEFTHYFSDHYPVTINIKTNKP